MTLTPDEAAAAIATGSDAEMRRLQQRLAADLPMAAALLGELANNRNVAVRDWVTWAARRFLDRGAAIGILRRLAEDADSDVRLEAVAELVDLDESWARRLVPTLRKMLSSRDPIEVSNAIWHLVRVRDSSALAPIQNLAERAPETLVKNQARAAVLVLTGAEDELVKLLVAHDHRRAPLWIKCLLYLGSERALAALQDFALHGPDEECRRRASTALTKLQQVKPIGIH